MKEPVVVNYYRRMRVQRVFPLTVDLQASEALNGRVQVRPIIPGAFVTPGIREVELGPQGSTLRFSVTPMAWGRLPHGRISLFQNGRHAGNVPLPMKGVRQLDTWLFLYSDSGGYPATSRSHGRCIPNPGQSRGQSTSADWRKGRREVACDYGA